MVFNGKIVRSINCFYFFVNILLLLNIYLHLLQDWHYAFYILLMPYNICIDLILTKFKNTAKALKTSKLSWNTQ